MSDTPWFKEPPLWTCSQRDDGRMTQLHQELEEFYEQARPKQKDAEIRAHALERVKLAIRAFWPSCEVKVFGSFSTGLYLPKVSDIDIVILGSPSGTEHFRALGAALRSSGIARHVDFIGRAKVPILKFREDRSGIHFDVSFSLNQELRAAELISSSLASYPCLAPLYLFLKAYVQLKQLNEVYHTGGLNSYTLFVMLYTFLQSHPNGCQALSESGFLLAGFFHFYGVCLKVQEYGISCVSGARFFLKSQRGFMDVWKPYLLAVEDPFRPTNDIGKNSFNFPKIQATFKESYELLMFSHYNSGPFPLLNAILPLQSSGMRLILSKT
ncbi:hypothetical protein GOP47_0008721 [Adiantum capillus-veneris]|uniref:polynucleotide adenylyltransferase n=1 Tax=Adiantum capillus-veneris TaxID=13818 RepID=A0A9D4UZE6_ADICA|nr:hypothetical protein GOP47_0008721 [Adiantum capillus-veneris]